MVGTSVGEIQNFTGEFSMATVILSLGWMFLQCQYGNIMASNGYNSFFLILLAAAIFYDITRD